LFSGIKGGTETLFVNSVLRKIFESKGDEVIGSWRKLNNGELHNLYCSPSIIRIMKSKRMRWARHVARMAGNAYRIFVESRRKRGH
jgi:hypothetical protein